MNYSECLRSTYFDLESWLITLLGFGISLILWKWGKTAVAMISACVSLSLGVLWAYSHYEFNCVELIGL